MNLEAKLRYWLNCKSKPKNKQDDESILINLINPNDAKLIHDCIIWNDGTKNRYFFEIETMTDRRLKRRTK